MKLSKTLVKVIESSILMNITSSIIFQINYLRFPILNQLNKTNNFKIKRIVINKREFYNFQERNTFILLKTKYQIILFLILFQSFVNLISFFLFQQRL